MKTKIYIIGLILTGLFSSCLGNLDPIVNDKIIPSNYFKNENDAKAAVTAIYQPFQTGWGGTIYSAWVGTYYMVSCLCTDELSLTRNDLEVVDKFLWTSTTGTLSSHYSNFIKNVSKATLLLDDLSNTPMNDKLKKQYMGEVLCVRASNLFYLYDFFGTAGVVMDPQVLRNPTQEVILERSSQADFVKLIEADLNEAASMLPTTYEAKDWGRFTKGAALTILLKLYQQEKRWADAEKVAREIVQLKCYGLQDTYESVFSADNEKNNEIIWAIPCLSEGGFGNMWLTHIVPPGYPLKNNNIQRWYVHNTPWDFYDRYEKGDERLKLLVGEFEYVPEGETEPVLATRYNFEHLKKGALPIKYPEDSKQTTEYAGNDLVIYRYADVLLALAEVINEQNGPTKEAIDLVMEIRNRAGLTAPLASAVTQSKEAFRDFILDERGRELFCEGHRRRDLIRHGKLISTAISEGYINAKPYMTLFPLPQNILDESKGKIKQNPGY